MGDVFGAMSLEGQGSLYQHIRGRLVIYVPADVQKDSSFPFQAGEKVKVRIVGKKLVIEAARDKK